MYEELVPIIGLDMGADAGNLGVHIRWFNPLERGPEKSSAAMCAQIGNTRNRFQRYGVDERGHELFRKNIRSWWNSGTPLLEFRLLKLASRYVRRSDTETKLTCLVEKINEDLQKTFPVESYSGIGLI